MISAFGVEHDFSKAAKKQPRDALGRWKAAHTQGKQDVKMHGPLSDDDLDQQYEWYHPDYKSLSMLAQTDPKEFRKKRKEMLEDAHYWHGRKEFDLSDDILVAIESSDEAHAKHYGKKPAKRIPDLDEIHKGYKKLFPKLARGLEDRSVGQHQTMNQKLRRHAGQARMAAGGQGQSLLRRLPAERREAMLNGPFQGKYTKPGTRREVLRQQKVGAQGIYDRLGREGRKNKVLP